jgi:two-component system, OmpR family, response regulator TrcR
MMQKPTKKYRVLLAEDDTSLGSLIKDHLIEAGYDVELCSDGGQAIEKFNKDDFDICILDIMMPEKDGYAVAKKIRQQSDIIPILFLTAKTLEEDRIKGFVTGADDYITKPFSMQELLLRLDVFLRSKKFESAAKSFEIGTIRFDPAALRLDTTEENFHLTQKEADLLAFLCANTNRILKREEILLNVWGKDDYFLGRSMDVFMTKLRKYFKSDPDVTLETIHGIGFRLNVK